LEQQPYSPHCADLQVGEQLTVTRCSDELFAFAHCLALNDSIAIIFGIIFDGVIGLRAYRL